MKIQSSLVVLISFFAILAGEQLMASSPFSIKLNDAFPNENARRLAKAAAEGKVKEIDRLVAAGTDVNYKGAGGVTPLVWPMRTLNKTGFNKLLELGANPNAQWESGASVTYWVAGLSDPVFMKAVLTHGGDPNLINPRGHETPIFRAITPEGKVNLSPLIQAGANLNAQDSQGSTPLMAAADLNQFDVVYTLLCNGADFNLKDKWGKTITYAIENNNIDATSEGYRWREKSIAFLRTRGVRVNPRIP
jgi:ankyrin repeat protein